MNLIVYSIAVKFFDCEGLWVSALSSSILWYLSREVRDHEKLGYWDWEGLYAPTLGLVYVFVICQLGTCYYKYRITKEEPHYPYVSRYTLTFCSFLFVGNTTTSFVVSMWDYDWD